LRIFVYFCTAHGKVKMIVIIYNIFQPNFTINDALSNCAN
jgi:hypothetical protein